MDVATSGLSQHNYPVKVIDLRRCARRVVRMPTTLASKGGRANGVVTNISEGGCELRDVSCDWSPLPFLPKEEITLTLYPHKGTAALQITLAEIRWVKRELAGVEFVSLSQEDQAKLQGLCSTECD